MVALAQALGADVVVEGVECAEDVRVAFDAGVDWLQGIPTASSVARQLRVGLHAADARHGDATRTVKP